MVVMNKVVSKKKGLTFPGKYLVTFVTVSYRHGEFLSILEKTASVQMKICERAGGDSPMQYSKNLRKINNSIFSCRKKFRLCLKGEGEGPGQTIFN